MVKEEMGMWAEGKFDVICLQDLRLSAPRIREFVKTMKALWRGEDIKFRYLDAHHKFNGGKRHGVMIAVHERCKNMVHSWIDDSRGWGRYVAVIMVGGKVNGRAEKLVITSCYAPAVGTNHYK